MGKENKKPKPIDEELQLKLKSMHEGNPVAHWGPQTGSGQETVIVQYNQLLRRIKPFVAEATCFGNLTHSNGSLKTILWAFWFD